MLSEFIIFSILFVIVVVGSIYIVIHLDDGSENKCKIDDGNSAFEELERGDARLNDVMPASSFWSAIGFIGLAISFAAAVWAFLMDTTVPAYSLGVSEVNNLGLLQQQMMVYIGSIGMFVAGVVALSTGAILKSLDGR